MGQEDGVGDVAVVGEDKGGNVGGMRDYGDIMNRT